MKRDLYVILLNWKKGKTRKPLLLKGARQVGKTTLLKNFGKQEYAHVAYLNFEEDKLLASFFSSNLKPLEVIKKIALYQNIPISEETLIIFDEIQECPAALNSLKYFCEELPNYSVVAAGSLLGVKLKSKNGFPVGKVEFQTLFPLTFFEFLDAIHRSELREYLESIKKIEPLTEALHLQLIDLLKTYMITGGMPEAVAQYVENQDLIKVRQIQKNILEAYAHDFVQHADPMSVMKIQKVWESIPPQLARENKKFTFSAISKSARAREYEEAIQWLSQAGLIYQVFNLSTPQLPLQRYTEANAFKIYFLDVGLLGAMTQLSPDIILRSDHLFQEYNGAFTENFVLQSLWVKHAREVFYWTSGNTAEIDFLFLFENHIIPLEVKSGYSKHKKSLRLYMEKYHPAYTARVTLYNLKKDGALVNYPLYLVDRIPIF